MLSNEHCNIRINLVGSFDGWLKDKNSGIYIFFVIYLLVFFNELGIGRKEYLELVENKITGTDKQS